MARSVLSILSLCSVLLIVWADDRTHFVEQNERRWNTPPELVPEQVAKKSDTKSERPRSLSIPITANINLNTGDNAHSLGFQAGPQGLSYSESASFSRPLFDANGSSVSQSQSLSFAAGSAGIAGTTAEAVDQRNPVYGNQGNVDSQVFGIGNAAASSYGAVQNGHATSAAASSVGSGYSSASSGAESGRIVEGGELTIKFPGLSQRLPIWTNIRPNFNNGYYPSNRPKLNIDVRPHDGFNRGTIRLDVTPQETHWENRRPNVHIHKWRPGYASHDFHE